MATEIRPAPFSHRVAAWTVLCAFVLALPGSPPALAAPGGEVVLEGDATFTRDGDTTTIDTSTDQTIVEYDTFDIEIHEIVRINQPNEDSRILNRVPHGDPTRIDGELTSNGIVYILNPAGVFAGDRAIIDVSGLVAGAGELSNDDFLAGVDDFTALTGDVIVAEGARIEATDLVALVGRRVANYGSIRTEGGMIALVAGDRAVLARLDGHLRVKVDASHAEALPEDAGFALTQAGLVDAGTGAVSLTAGDTYSLAMNHTGITHGREIELHAGGDGLVQVAGSLDASAPEEGETGGSIHVTGEKVALLDARLDASGEAGGGEILVGGAAHGAGELRNARRTFVGAEAELVADAVGAGDGGVIVVWSDEKTGFYGTASARGGDVSGDGGFVEISGKSLVSTGHVDLGAAHGSSGTLLYDPDRILIMGGAGDGTDGTNNLVDTSPDSVVGDDGTAGRILEGHAGPTDADGVPIEDPFVIYESEIEGTDADIILEATTQIKTDGTFDNDAGGEDTGVVVLLPGNSLRMTTRGNGLADPDAADPTELVGIDLGDLEWRVSEGGTIALETLVGDNDAATEGVQSSIKVGRLVYGGPSYVENDVGIEFPENPIGSPNRELAVRVTTVQGNIEIGSIAADGADATENLADGAPASDNRVAADGGDVDVRAVFGDITILGANPENLAVSATGGGTASGIAADGGRGGLVAITTTVGTVTVEGDIDVSGGAGLAGFRQVDADADEDGIPDRQSVAGAGGAGGIIRITNELGTVTDPGGEVVIHGDLIARGGDGEGFFALPTNNGPATFVAAGGLGGRIFVSAVEALTIEGLGGDRLTIDASAGDGAGAGAPVILDPSAFTVDLKTTGLPPTADDPEVPEAAGDIRLDGVDFVADGGDAGNAGGPGGAGGAAGRFRVISDRGTVDASNATFQANGGAGAVGSEGPDAPAGSGGAGGFLTVNATAGIQAGKVALLGGDAKNGIGGAGGEVKLSSDNGAVEVVAHADVTDPGIDVSGGDAERVANTIPVGVGTFAGGAGGTVTLTTGENTIDPTGGNIEIRESVIARAGIGIAPTIEAGELADEAVVASGGRVDIDADAGVLSFDGAVIQANRIEIDADGVSVGPDPVGVDVLLEGTAAADDRALVAVTGDLQVELTGDPSEVLSDDSFLESVTVVQRDVGSDSTVTRNAVTLLSVMGDPGVPPDPDDPADLGVPAEQRVLGMATTDADAELHFRFENAVAAPESLVIASALSIGANGGGLANGTLPDADNAGDIESDGGSIETAGLFSLEGRGIGTAPTVDTLAIPIGVAGTSDEAALAVSANGHVFVDVVTPLKGIGVSQWSAIGTTNISLENDEAISVVVSDGATALAPRHEITADTRQNGTSFAYHLEADTPIDPDPDDEQNPVAPALDVLSMTLGGSGWLDAPGDIVIGESAPDEATISVTDGGHLTLVSGGDIAFASTDPVANDRVAIDMGAGDPEVDANLVLDAGGAVGSADAPIVTRGIDQVAGVHDGGFHLTNVGTGDIRIADLVPIDPIDLSEESPVTGIRVRTVEGEGAVRLVNSSDTGKIVLGTLGVGSLGGSATHIGNIGDIYLDGDVEIENAQFVPNAKVDENGALVTEFAAVNRARLFSLGDIEITGGVDTSAGAIALDERETIPDSLRLSDFFTAGALVLESDGGTVTVGGDIGVASTLALFDTTSVVLTGDTDIHSGQALFRGTLDSDGDIAILGEGVEGFSSVGGEEEISPAEDTATFVSFAGDIGTKSGLTGLAITADSVSFSSAERVEVAGDMSIDTYDGTDEIPTKATIADISGNLAIVTDGDFTIGTHGKFSSTGAIDIRAAGNVTVGDLSAHAIHLQADTDGQGGGDIIVMRRAAGDVELPDGTTVFEGDGPNGLTEGGVDLVANDIFLGSNAIFTGTGPTPTLVIGSGGLSIPGNLSDWHLIRYTPDLQAVEPEDFVAAAGSEGSGALDLRGTGGLFAGNPAGQLERGATVEPEPAPVRATQVTPAPAPPVAAREVFAFLRCGAVAADGTTEHGCASADAEALRALDRFHDSALATPRAREMAARYRALLLDAEGVARLRADFAEADRAFAGTREWSDGTIDGAALYRFLAASRAAPGALEALRDLAWLDAQVGLLALSDDDARALQRRLVDEFAGAADLPSLDAVQIRAAIATVGLASR